MQNRSLNRSLIGEIATWFVVAIGMWAYSYEFDSHIPNFELGPLIWPRVVLILIGACALGLLVSSWGSIRQSVEAFGRPSSSEGEDAGPTRLVVLKLLATFALPLLYVWLLPLAGFFATTPFFLAGYMYVFGQRSPIHLIGTALSIYVGITLIFSKFLFLPLPVGVWPGFYDFGNAILILLGNN